MVDPDAGRKDRHRPNMFHDVRSQTFATHQREGPCLFGSSWFYPLPECRERCDANCVSKLNRIESVRADFVMDLRICYHVRLSCGCSYWEYRPIDAAPPKKGEAGTCGIVHTTKLEQPAHSYVDA
jgi:hypothetical protein